ncbi:hypothetical protein [Amycolatopsis sp. YIM 10]|uniref:hypothetical protein n=1 Tax=Amycolatopsis sp. YIM 10 TaxID=2653857 RepID=UPI0012900885|nr:hypothetical protein [Amycolatopsis sp. YIM 10]QFU89786.1 hypothetical protein YIM_23045 [Amycolatopsis sp. YIM 10]
MFIAAPIASAGTTSTDSIEFIYGSYPTEEACVHDGQLGEYFGTWGHLDWACFYSTSQGAWLLSINDEA